MDYFDFAAAAGGLALFLYGMLLMSESLSRMSGGRLSFLLEKLTDTPVKAVLSGTLATAFLQSSSAVTVMVVGFADSGLMGLSQAAGVIMGANIGTTATAWILSAAGRGSASFWVRLTDPIAFAPPAALAGVLFLLFFRDGRRGASGGRGRPSGEKGSVLAYAAVGFDLLIFGMDAMSRAVEPLSLSPGFQGIVTRFSDPVLGMGAGALLTAVIQSSSASVGILQAFCKTGAVRLQTAAFVIAGENIGTCATALLSCVGASANAKRAALVHLYFNLFGAGLFLAVFWLSGFVLPDAFWGRPADSADIALLHSAFNMAAALCLLPFSDGLVRLACRTVRDRRPLLRQ